MKQPQQPQSVPSNQKLPPVGSDKAPPVVLSEAELKQVSGGLRVTSTQTPTKGW